VDGLLKDSRNYQGFDPAELGRSHRFVLGKHSGTAGLRAAYRRLGLQLRDDLVPLLLERIKAFAVATKREASDVELEALYHNLFDHSHLDLCADLSSDAAARIAHAA
jgi:homocitrate synthase NifV